MSADVLNPKDVLVIGAGVAGIQASLDLAEMGVHVHLVERQPTIGGRMAQLDTIFPTGCHGGCRHCAASVLSGESVDCAEHPNITLHTYSEVKEVRDSAGSFAVSLLKHPRFVDEEACIACGDCVDVCPVTIPDEFNAGLSERRAIYIPHEQAIPRTYLVSKRGTAPCKASCPAETSAQGYISLIAQGRYEEALEVIKQYNPFPATVGRACTHPCEEVCIRGRVDRPVSICALKRFVADWVYAHTEATTPAPPAKSGRAERVAIIGAGPAGLSAAHFLARMGYRATIFEAMSVAGGMMRQTIPSYRLPRDVLQREIDNILALGIELKLYHPISDVDALFDEGYKAVFLAIGAHQPQRLRIPGENAKGVYQGVPFLRTVSLGEEIRLGEKVVVVGGGNTAIDAARSALRLGAHEVTIVYDLSRADMQARTRGIEEAEEEGIKLELLTLAVEVVAEDDHVTGVRCVRTRLGEPNERGFRMPVPVEDSEFVLRADTLIAAVGQTPEASFLKPGHGLEIGPRGTFVVNTQTLETNHPGVFAGGGSARGQNVLIQAIADGRRAALSIDRHVRGVPLLTPRELQPLPVAHLTDEEMSELIQAEDVNAGPREVMRTAPAQDRIRDFREVEFGLTEEQARAEASRCLECGLCSECGLCVDKCPVDCIDHQMTEETLDLHVGSVVLATGFDPFDPSVIRQYGYGTHKNVITSLEYERLISASGPTGGRLQRLSDGKEAKRLAFIQCVGSRDIRHNRFCSSICCMFATQEAIVAGERVPGVRSTIFYADLRAAGKGFEKCLATAKSDYGVNYVRARVGEITQDADESPVIWYEDIPTGEKKSEAVDLAVLVIGLSPRRGMEELADLVGVELDEGGFIKTEPFSPTDTTRPGVFACGFSRGPADVSQSVAQAGAAAARAAEFVMRGAHLVKAHS